MSLIERQTAIEAIAYSIELCNKALDSMTLGGRDRYAVEVERNSLLKLKDDFKLLPSAQPEQRWFPCSEKLPERGKDVLVTRHYLGEEDNNKSCYYTEVAARYGDDDNPDWISFSDEYKMHPKNHIVIAWQELPEPYKGEMNEKR